ncbi:MAG: hypothetical protein H6567_07140 [Lewinellaceae bacterium]|nr:hypothetical protein [Lewinellaceae bacterium]
MQFSQIPGKEVVKKQIFNQIHSGKIPHASIFLGGEGSGNLTMAMALATYLVCQSPTENDSCGTCNACLKMSKWIHPDVHFAFPVIKKGTLSRAETTSDDFIKEWREFLQKYPYGNISDWLQMLDAGTTQPNINVKECQEIVRKLNMMSFESGKKILIVWLPEYLGHEGNRLLKLIEEPTDDTYIFFIAHNQDAILQTIISRCQVTRIPLFDHEEISETLKKQFELSNEEIDQITTLSNGNINTALAMAKNELKDYSQILIDWLRTNYRSDYGEMMKSVNQIAGMSKENLTNFFDYGLHFLRQILMMKYYDEDQVAQIPEKDKATIKKMGALINVEKASQLSDLFSEAMEGVSRNMNMKILLFADSIKISEILRKP